MGKFFFKKRKKFGFGRGLAVMSWDVRFWAKNRGEVVTVSERMLVFGLKMAALEADKITALEAGKIKRAVFRLILRVRW